MTEKKASSLFSISGETCLLVRSSRRTLALTLDREGRLTVRAPKRMPMPQIAAFVAQKRAWLASARARLAAGAVEPFDLTEGALLPLEGVPCPVTLCAVRTPRLEEGRLLVPARWAERPNVAARCKPLIAWLRSLALERFTPLAKAWADRTGLRPRSLHISAAKGRWGSMSAAGDLRLNVSLLLCPPEILEYAIVHELAHIAHMDHSPAFWALVSQLLPAAPECRRWLKAHGALIRLLPR